MDVHSLKPRLGRWLAVEEIRDLLSEQPDHLVQQLPVNRKLLETASVFVEQRAGSWEHEDWNGFLAGLWEQGFQVAEENHALIGSLLEIFKAYHRRGDFHAIAENRRKPPAPRKPAAAGKKKAKPPRKRGV